jgi:hypothetical protein
MLQRRPRAVYIQHNLDAGLPGSDKMVRRLSALNHDKGQNMSTPWATGMKATSIEKPARLVPTLVGAILGCGGWVLSRGANDAGTVNILFEFERQACVEIYTVLAATSGLPNFASALATIDSIAARRSSASSWRFRPSRRR